MKILQGIVTSISMTNVAVVEVTRRVPHVLYKKLVKKSKKFKVRIGSAPLVLDQKVSIVETKPSAKGVYFKIMEGKK